MKREVVVAVAGLTVVVAGLSGCSKGSSKPEAKVTVGGQEQHPQGGVKCASHDGTLAITIGDPNTGVVAMLSDTDSPEVRSVVFGDVDGSQLMYVQDMPVSGTATETKATKDGKQYKISGTASKLDTVANPESKPFEVDVTCP
ncbi:lipoprotein LpqH [Mycobacterium sp. pUA109]|uniref:lipoprotein LpqH n=1 Tax=Mycobacterium sp. pUA109 TaxID=3238982 RepID=UPI00351B8784